MEKNILTNNMSNTTWNPIENLERRQEAFKLRAKKEIIHPYKELSSRYLNDAKRLGYKWSDLIKKETREKVINKVINLKMTEGIKKAKQDSKKQAKRDAKLKKKMDKIKRMNEKIIGKQTVDVLIFQRFENKEDIPRDRKVAFRDHYGKPYIMRFRRYFIVDKIMNANRYIVKGVYDYNDNDFDRVVKYLDTSHDFQMFNKGYVNCIILDSIANINDMGKSSDVSDNDLFMTRKEDGIYNRNVKLNREEETIDNNSCFVNLIVKRFQKAFEKASIYQKYKFVLTTKSLCELCGIEYKERDMGLSVKKCLVFFKKFNLGLHVYGPFGTVFKYKPEKRNKHLNPSHLFIYILNNHCYEINENVKEFERLHWEKTEDIDNEVDSMTVSNKYNIRQQSINKELPQFMDTQEEVIDFVKSYDTKSVEDIKIVTIVLNDYLDTLLFGIISNLRYTQEIKMMSGKITALLVKYDNVIFYITLADTKANDTDVWIKKDDYELYHNVDDTFYNGLICHEHMSAYNKQTINIENLLPIGPKSGYFVEHVSQPLMGIDSRKAYTSDFMNIEY